MKESAYLLRIPEDLYHRFKLRCVKDKVSIKDRLVYLVEKDLNNPKRRK